MEDAHGQSAVVVALKLYCIGLDTRVQLPILCSLARAASETMTSYM